MELNLQGGNTSMAETLVEPAEVKPTPEVQPAPVKEAEIHGLAQEEMRDPNQITILNSATLLQI